MTGVMAHTLIGCVLVILTASSWSVGSNLPTSTASCNQKKGFDQRKCFLTADCPICATSQVRCFDGALLKPFYEKRFDDEFCGQHGVVLVQLNSTASPYLAPLECRHGMCPFGSQCLIGPIDSRPYCCSTGPIDSIRCTTLDVIKASRSRGQTLQHRVVDESGQPVSISRVSLVLQSSDLACVQGWSYAFRGDSVFLTNNCKVRFQVCYEPGRPPLSDQLAGPGQICDTIHLLSRPSHPAVKIYKDALGTPLNITSLTLLEQLSIRPCLEGTSFNFSGSQVQASGGCRGLFSVCYTADLDLVTPAPTPVARDCQQFTLKCKFRQHVSRRILNKNKNPVTVVSMRLVKKLSSAACVEGTSFNFRDSRVFVSQGCQGRFEICYLREQVTALTTSAAFNGRVGTTVRTRTSTQRTTVREATSTKTAETTSQAARTTSKTTEQTTPTTVLTTESIPQPTTVVITESTTALTTIVTTESTTTLTTTIPTESTTLSPNVTTTTLTSTVKTTKQISPRMTTSLEPELDEDCEVIELMSNVSFTDRRTIRDFQGNPESISSMEVQERFSAVPCILGKTFNFSDREVSVWGGCRATFLVCLKYPDDRDFTNTTAATSSSSTSNTTLPTTSTPVTDTTTGYPTTPITTPTIDTTVELTTNTTATPTSTITTPASSETTPITDTTTTAITSTTLTTFALTTSDSTTTPSTETTTNPINISSTTTPILIDVSTPREFKEVTISSTTTAVLQKELQCKEITLQGTGFNRVFNTFLDHQHGPVQVVSMRLVQQLSEVTCILWVNYFFEGNTVLAKDGCNGRFQVCLVDRVPSIPSPWPSTRVPGLSCRVITAFSVANQPAHKANTDFQGNDAPFRTMELLSQWSQAACVQGDTFRFSDEELVVSGGCGGLFWVCYECIGSKKVTAGPGDACGKELTVFSTINTPQEMTIRDTSHRPVLISRVLLLDQFSEIECILGSSYTFIGSTLRVTDGCRGVFKVCHRTPGTPTTSPVTTPTESVAELEPGCKKVRLSSYQGPLKKTFTDRNDQLMIIRSVRLLQQLSEEECAEGRSFQVSSTVIHLWNGCGGYFQVCLDTEEFTVTITTNKPKETEAELVPGCKKFRLVSSFQRPLRKTFTDRNDQSMIIRSVQLLQQLSKEDCVEGRNFRVSSTVIHLWNGCGGYFQVCFDTEEFTVTTTTNKPKESLEKVCETIYLLSTFYRPAKKLMTDTEGNPVKILSLTLVEQFSQHPCLDGETFFFSRSKAKAIKGCRGSFEVCYDNGEDDTDESEGGESNGARKSKDKGSRRSPRGRTSGRRHNSEEEEAGRIREDTDANKGRPDKSKSSKNKECLKLTIISRDGRARALQMTGRDKKPVNVVSVSVQQQISPDPCIRGDTFNFRGSNVWARDGCGAVFLICYQKKQEPEAREDEDCRTVKLFSGDNNLEKTTLTDRNGHLVTVVRMTLLTQSSEVMCAQGDTFDFEGSKVWVSEGCRATFKVCYRSRRVPEEW